MVFFQNRKHGHQAIVLSSRSVSVARQIIAEVAESLFCNFIQETNLTERLSKLQFVARRLAGEPMADLCREFGISRKTGYKIFDRYKECGVQGLTDRSRNVKREHTSWGARGEA